MAESILSILLDARRAAKGDRAGIERRQRARLSEMVAFARERSPYNRELYRGLPDCIEDPSALPVIDKKRLMARFDDWCTDRAVTLEAAEAVVDDPARIGERFLGKYTLYTTSGTTGRRGVFPAADRTMAVVTAMMLRWIGRRPSPRARACSSCFGS